jgi:hypothetical protein
MPVHDQKASKKSGIELAIAYLIAQSGAVHKSARLFRKMDELARKM